MIYCEMMPWPSFSLVQVSSAFWYINHDHFIRLYQEFSSILLVQADEAVSELILMDFDVVEVGSITEYIGAWCP